MSISLDSIKLVMTEAQVDGHRMGKNLRQFYLANWLAELPYIRIRRKLGLVSFKALVCQVSMGEIESVDPGSTTRQNRTVGPLSSAIDW